MRKVSIILIIVIIFQLHGPAQPKCFKIPGSQVQKITSSTVNHTYCTASETDFYSTSEFLNICLLID